MSQGLVHSEESFGSADGPGVRYLVFLSGCNLRCAYCHNPDTWAGVAKAQAKDPAEILRRALRYRDYWGSKGGITVSGGEPLLQPEFLEEFFRLAKKEGVHTCIDTAGEPFTREEPKFSQLEKVVDLTDLFLLDLKHIDSEKHRQLTGRPNENILDFARYLSDRGKPVWIRHVLVPGWTTDRESLEKTAAFVKTLKNVERIDILPYHTLGVFKWDQLGIPYRLQGVNPPTDEEIALAHEILHV